MCIRDRVLGDELVGPGAADHRQVVLHQARTCRRQRVEGEQHVGAQHLFHAPGGKQFDRLAAQGQQFGRVGAGRGAQQGQACLLYTSRCV